jgi:hypothetical protein
VFQIGLLVIANMVSVVVARHKLVSLEARCIAGILKEHHRKQFNYKGFEELSFSKWGSL